MPSEQWNARNELLTLHCNSVKGHARMRARDVLAYGDCFGVLSKCSTD